MIIPFESNLPNIHKSVYMNEHKIYRALLYTYTVEYVVKKDENGNIVKNESIKRIYIWPFNDWDRIASDLS